MDSVGRPNYYNGWWIYQAPEKTDKGYTLYVAIKTDYPPVWGTDYPDLLSDLDEYHRGKKQK
jgi:hypothetical protein